MAADIVASSGTARAWGLDVADSAATIRVVAEVAAAFGGLDIVINNAGVAQFLALDDPAYDEHWSRVLAILLTAPQRVVRAALPHLRKSRAGRVINIASTEALAAQNKNSIYGAPTAAAPHAPAGHRRQAASSADATTRLGRSRHSKSAPAR